MYYYKLLISIICISIFSLDLVYAASCENYSSPARVQLVELYTSEGCSSCPPADSWLRALVPNVLSAEEVVPLAFHVDYWDRLGWRDRFASPLYTSRQSEYSKVSGSSFIFTPQVILAGRNYARWSNSNRVQQDVREALKSLPDAEIALRLQTVAAGKIGFEISAQLRQGVNSQDVRIYAALFQNGLVSDVGRGENSGSRLQHDYVVRELFQSKTIGQSGKLVFRDTFTLPDDARPVAMGVAVFAQDTKTGKVLQAMAAPLCIKKL
jgi:hypothetical protein